MEAKKILFVNACARSSSRTYELAKSLLDRLAGEVCEVALYGEDIRPLDQAALESRNRNLEARNYDHPDFGYARQFAQADTIVIAAPYWDLLFPAVLRSYLEATSVTGITFAYSEQGVPYGLCKAKRLYYVTTAGGYMGENNFGFEYIKALAQKLYGLEEIRLLSAEGLDIFGANVEQIMHEAKQRIASM